MSSSISDPPTARSQLPVIVLLFIIMRLTIMFLYTPQGMMNQYTDYFYYFQTAQLSDSGHLPFIDMWYEYPPVLAYLPQFAYTITRSILPAGDVFSPTFAVFSRILGTVLLVFETGVLILIQRIADALWNTEKADRLAWIYSGLSLPLFFWSFSHQSVVVFFSLLAVYGFLLHREKTSAVALGLGIASKLTPVLFLAPLLRFLWPRKRAILLFAVLVFLTVCVAYLPFLIMGGAPWIVASFLAILRVGSWNTPWAILEGNWGSGYYGPLETRLVLDWPLQNLPFSPGEIPGWIPFLLFGAVYCWLFFRPLDMRNPRHFLWFSALTLVVFHLYSKGWSQQWAVLFIPFFLLSFPDSLGLAFSLLLTALGFLQWPVASALHARFLSGLIIAARTFLLAYFGVLLGRRLWLPAPQKIDVSDKDRA
jgi:hypothetical protein